MQNIENYNIKTNKLMKQKQYFQYSMVWYYEKHISFFWEKKIFSLLFILIFSIICFGLYMNYQKFSFDPIIFNASSYLDTNNEILNIEKLENINKEKNPNITIANYLIKKYIYSMESIDHDLIQVNDKFILNNSSTLVYFYYKKRNEIYDENNPFINKEKGKNIEIIINHVNFFINQGGVPYKAKVDIYKKDKNLSEDNKNYLQKYNIEIDFLIDNVLFINKDSDRLNFLVLKYNKF